MKTPKEIKAKIKELEEEMAWAYSDEPKYSYYDPWEEVPRLQSQINMLTWVLNDESEVE